MSTKIDVCVGLKWVHVVRRIKQIKFSRKADQTQKLKKKRFSIQFNLVLWNESLIKK